MVLGMAHCGAGGSCRAILDSLPPLEGDERVSDNIFTIHHCTSAWEECVLLCSKKPCSHPLKLPIQIRRKRCPGGQKSEETVVVHESGRDGGCA